MDVKDFKGWFSVKTRIHGEEKIPTFREREIWWCSTGANVGVEQDGKNILYERPMLIIHKFNRRLFWGVPITTKIKDFPFYHPVYYKGVSDDVSRERRAVLSQMRAYDSARLSRPMGKLSHQQFNEIITLLAAILRKSPQ